MEVILKPGDVLEVSFESAEEKFTVSTNVNTPRFVAIIQTAGWQVTDENIDLEEIILYTSAWSGK